MTELFEGRVFSASNVARGKPHPDIFLHAASEMGIPPRECIVVEDSLSGVMAGRAAGCTVIGLLAGGHIREGHAAKLEVAGAHHVAAGYVEMHRIVIPNASRKPICPVGVTRTARVSPSRLSQPSSRHRRQIFRADDSRYVISAFAPIEARSAENAPT